MERRMSITKLGRNVFSACTLWITSLAPGTSYMVSLSGLLLSWLCILVALSLNPRLDLAPVDAIQPSTNALFTCIMFTALPLPPIPIRPFHKFSTVCSKMCLNWRTLIWRRTGWLGFLTRVRLTGRKINTFASLQSTSRWGKLSTAWLRLNNTRPRTFNRLNRSSSSDLQVS